jgi:methylated-DNA-protein-cysteine methyltransferase related protein
MPRDSPGSWYGSSLWFGSTCRSLQRSGPAVASGWRRPLSPEFLHEFCVSAVKFLLMSWQPVYRLIKKIPRGKVTTYGELARSLRLPGGARAVGYAMAACPSGQGIPWHRVVGAGGRLLIPEPHGSLQRRLLESEGVKLEGARINMSLFGWSPSRRKPRQRSRVQARR